MRILKLGLLAFIMALPLIVIIAFIYSRLPVSNDMRILLSFITGLLIGYFVVEIIQIKWGWFK